MPLHPFLARLRVMAWVEISHVQGFMQLLMKPRNGVPWSSEDKATITLHMKHLAKSLPVLLIFTFPGGSLLLPALVWFLDRRKNPKQPTSAATGNPTESSAEAPQKPVQ
jgi:hypothetical protein